METIENWVSLREFSRNRGVRLAAVQKAIESGRVTAVKRGNTGRLAGIEMNRATLEWNRNTDPDQAARAGNLTLPPTDELQFDSPAPSTAQPADDAVNASYLASRARRQEIEAKTAELEYAKALGQLVSSEELKRVNGRRYRALRDMLLNIPDRISTVVAAERDPARVHAAMTVELKRVLNELSDDAAAEVAGGVDERVAA